MRALLRSLALVLGLGAAHAAAAQPAALPVENVYARPGRPTVGVYVLGQVAAPGKWRVEEGTLLMDLLAVTRPTGVGMARVGVEEEVRVRLFRAAEGGGRRLFLESELEPLLLGAQAESPLREGDILEVAVTVRERRRMGFAEVTGVLSTLASLAVLVVSLAE